MLSLTSSWIGRTFLYQSESRPVPQVEVLAAAQILGASSRYQQPTIELVGQWFVFAVRKIKSCAVPEHVKRTVIDVTRFGVHDND